MAFNIGRPSATDSGVYLSRVGHIASLCFWKVTYCVGRRAASRRASGLPYSVGLFLSWDVGRRASGSPPPETRFSFFQQLAKSLCPLEPHRDSVHGGVVVSKSYCTVVEIHHVGSEQPSHWHSALTFNTDIHHWHPTLAFNSGIQHRHSRLAFNIDIRHQHSTLAFSLGH